MSLPVILLIFFALIAVSVPIGATMGVLAILPGVLDETFTANAVYVVRSMLNGIDSFPLLAVPMFVLSGVIMAKGGISKRLFNVFTYFLGKRTAGLPCAVIVTCLFYGAISGSAPATVAAVGSMTIPVLISLGYDKVFAVSVVAIAGGLGVIIPPSIPFILFGTSTGASVGKLFIAGIIPGVFIALLLMLYVWYYCKRKGENRPVIDAEVQKLRSLGLGKLLLDSSWALLTPVIILGSIYSGLASPTEAAVISVYYALLVSLFAYRSIKFKEVWPLFVEAVKTYGPIMFVISAAMAFSKVLNLLNVPGMINAYVVENFHSQISLLLMLNFILLIVGMVMDTSAAILVLAPLFTPIAAQMGVDPIHFGIIMTVNLAIGFVTPPMGINLFVASSLSSIPVMTIAKKAVPMIIVFLIALLIITFVPQISLLLVG
jgi:C4-dicarboxylate transporter DctM subunit